MTRPLTPIARRVWAMLDDRPGVREIARRVPCGVSTAWRVLCELERRGIIVRTRRRSRAYRVVERWRWVEE